MTWFADMCREMQSTHGERGWKRRLAQMLGVSDSNVQNWVRAGDAPPIVRTAYEAVERTRELEGELRERENDIYAVEEIGDGDSFRVLILDSETGRFIERATTKSLNLAHAIIQFESGALDRKIGALADRVGDLVEDHPDDKVALYDVLNWKVSTRREKTPKFQADFTIVLNPEQLEAMQSDK